MDNQVNGALFCAKYAFPPNQLHYCGPEKQNDLKAYLAESRSDTGLLEILNKFETVYPYLKFIAGLNHLKDPFNAKVVEAYWIGNSYLDKVKPNNMFVHVLDSLKYQHIYGVKGKKIASTAALGFPHHTFHVMNIFLRSGNMKVAHTLSTIDDCRIRVGKIIAINTDGTYRISTDTIKYDEISLCFGHDCKLDVTSSEKYEIGDWVSIHWMHICGRLNPRQKQNLMKYTNDSIRYANVYHTNPDLAA